MDVIKSLVKALSNLTCFIKGKTFLGRPKFAFILELTDLTAWLPGQTPEFEPQAPTYQLCNVGRVT